MLYCWRNPFFVVEFMLHTRLRLTSPSNTRGSDPIYIYYCYDIMENLSASCKDIRLVITCSLTVREDKHGDFGVRGSGDSSILGSVDSKQMVKNIFTSQKYISWSYFFKLLH